MVLIDATGQSHNGPPGIGVPVGRTQTGKGGHHITAVGVPDFLGHVFRVTGGLNEPQLVPQPLDGRTSHEDRTFQSVGNLAVYAPGDGSDQTVPGENRLLAGVHQQKSAGAVGDLGISRSETGLPEQRRLLIPRGAGDGDGSAEVLGIGFSVAAAGGLWLRQHGSGNPHQVQNFSVPLQGIDVEQHGPGGVGIVRHVNLSPGELPDQPCFHGAEQQLPGQCLLQSTGNVLQNPADFGGGEIGVDDQTGFGPDGVHEALLGELVAEGCGPAALPDNGVINRSSGEFVPDDGGFPLVGDADGGYVRGSSADVGQGLFGHFQLGGENLVRVMFHPARLGKDLGEFLLGHAADFSLGVEENAAVGGGSGIQCHDVSGHETSSFLCVFRNTIPYYLPVDNEMYVQQ